MMTVSNITKNTGRYADTYHVFYVPVNFVFNLPHYVTSYMHHTGKKESKKEILKTEEKNNVTKNLLQGDSNMDPQNQLEHTGHASVNLRSSVVVVFFFFFCFFASLAR